MPKLRDSLSYLNVEHAVRNQKDHTIEYIREGEGRVMIPIVYLSVLLLGPGTKITHAAIRTLSDNGSAVVWVGEPGKSSVHRGLVKRVVPIICPGRRNGITPFTGSVGRMTHDTGRVTEAEHLSLHLECGLKLFFLGDLILLKVMVTYENPCFRKQ